MRCVRVALLCALLAWPPARAQAEPPCPPAPPPLPAAGPGLDAGRRLHLFDEVLALLRGERPASLFGPLASTELRQRHLAPLLAARSDAEVYARLGELAAEAGATLQPPQAPEPDVYGGIGVRMNVIGDGFALEIREVFAGGPAAAAGLQRGDRIVAVDGERRCLAFGDIRGEVGTALHLEVQSPGEAPRAVELVRAPVRPEAIVEGYRLPDHPDLGYLWVADYLLPDTADRLLEALDELGVRLREADPPAGLVLDLRGIGGCRHDAMERALMHLLPGPYYFIDEGDGNGPTPGPGAFRTLLGVRVAEIPLALLVDGGTAGCLEALAGTLQASGRALLVGEPTAGDTAAGPEHTLSDGSLLWVPDSELVLPDGRSLLGRGVTPDVPVAVSTGAWYRPGGADDPFLQAAVRALAARVR